jgi:hypothetical protein
MPLLQDLLDRDRRLVRIGVRGHRVQAREKGAETLFRLEFALPMRDADQRRPDALGHRLDLVQLPGPGAPEIVFVNDIAAAGHDNGFEVAVTALLDGLTEPVERLRRQERRPVNQQDERRRRRARNGGR